MAIRRILQVSGVLLLVALLPTAASAAESAVADAVADKRLARAEGMIDAFYSFEPKRLAPFLEDAGEYAKRLMYYQGWAEGGNYKIVRRAPCAVVDSPQVIACPITVQDDPVMALGMTFKVTDTFTLTFDGLKIAKVATSSDDKPLYHQAREWVVENMPQIMEGPCKGFFAGGATPGECAQAMTKGYASFAASEDFPGLD
ncbi:MAG: hypothetical protein AAGA68_13870 [Pseudomonadota bacterium]